MTDMDGAPEKSIIGSGSLAFADGHRETLHVHVDYAQLKWPSTGVASVRTPSGIFVASAAFAVWIPAGQRHGGIYSGDVLEQNLFVLRARCDKLPSKPCLIAVPPSLAATIERTVESHAGYAPRSRAADEAVLAELERSVADAGRQALALELPERSTIQPVLEGLLRAPGDPRTLADWSQELGLAERTLRRAFSREVGISFGDYRKRARALHALRSLCTGRDVATVARELGYASPSAFVHMFRTLLGVTPARYYEARAS
jgi:AraC-like DNA-binding protein